MAKEREPGPDTCHPDYDEALAHWEMMADVLAGEDAVKAAGAKYLPCFEETETEDYERYKQRADFDEVTLRASKAMRGFLFRKDPRLEAPGHEPGKPEPKDGAGQTNGFDEFLNDSTLTGKEFYDVGKDCASTVLDYGRGGSLIDWSEDEKQPFVVQYEARDIINWRYERVAGRMVLTQIVLHERDPNSYDAKGNKADAASDYEHEFYDQWRELRLDDTGVTQYLWRKREATARDKPQEFYLVKKPEQPMRKTQPLMEIPFVFHTADGPHGEYVCPPPLLPMARMNLSLYRTNADLENARHILGMPTPWTAGFGDPSTPLYLGSTKAWSTDDVNAKAGFLALTGADIQPLTDAVTEKQNKMASFGARFLDAQSAQGRGPEAFGTVALRQTSETATLTDVSLALTQSLTNVLAWALWWTSSLKDVADARRSVSYTVNTDFVGVVMGAEEMKALMALYLQKGISFETLFARLQGADIIPADRTVEQEKELIAKDESLLLGLAGGAPPFPGKPPAGQQPPPPPPGKQPPPPKGNNQPPKLPSQPPKGKKPAA
jgi:hypothetical protein